MSVEIWLLAAGIMIAAGALWYVYFYQKEKRQLRRLQEMIDQAQEGKFLYKEISESSLSALENSLKRFLDDSLLAQEERKKQKETVQSLISDIAHQTLTPVANLKLYAELLKEEYADAENGCGELLETIQEQTDKLDFLIQSLVKLSRLENGIIEVRPKEQKIMPLLEQIRREYDGKAKEKGICLEIAESSLTAGFDLKWTREAVANIVDNAIKYTPSNGHVSVEAEQYPSFVRIDVRDNGVGIAEEELGRIFQRFYRSSETAQQPGVGIGLYLAREIIRMQHGYIKVSSEKGKGTVFSVFLSA